MTTVRHWTGAETKALRQAMRLSIRDFAAHVDVGVRTVARWESRGASITLVPDSQGLLDTVLARAANEVKQRFAETSAAAESGKRESADSDGAIVFSTANPDEMRHPATAVAEAQANFDGSVVDFFTHRFEACMAEDGATGPAATLPTVLALLGGIERSAHDVRADVRRSLLSVGARGAEFAGWLYRDVHDVVRARFWYDRATEWAQEAGDIPMQGYVLLKRSQMAYDDRDAVRVLTFAQAAERGPWQLPARVRAEVTQQEARGLAMTGEPMRLIEQKLEDARRLLADADVDEPRDQLGAYYNEGTLNLRTASCYIEAGKPRHAAELYRQVLEAGLLSRRDQGYFMARMASSLALSGEPDEAAAVAINAAELALATASQRTKRELGRTLFALKHWDSRPGPQQLRAALSTPNE